ncbi:Uncharacterised protein [Legionella busanensis]|uniref:Uncharacterized protein n=1 Tax=Legionella busanensis TaxID=190655 RepID=A0A378JQV3_9GAMM|nr:hypothetical protein [Legionella busanensis]STX52633.1 Uncharacterised protein [Legionella busanensis]
MLLTRKQFVELCNRAIFYTREKITIRNQKSGYQNYHRELKENRYFSINVRPPLINSSEHSYIYRHDFIEYTGLGNCHELAHFLLVEIGKRIEAYNATARLRVVSSKKFDHVYIEVLIQLANEIEVSRWEVDAWDPRIIDISIRPDGSIKNSEYLDYGYAVFTLNSIYSHEINYQKRYTFFQNPPKPIPGPPDLNATPEREILDKHPDLYRDYTLEESIKEGKIDPDGSIHYLQKASTWQL